MPESHPSNTFLDPRYESYRLRRGVASRRAALHCHAQFRWGRELSRLHVRSHSIQRGAPELRRAAHERCSLAVAVSALQLREAAAQSKGWLDGRRSNARVANKALKTLLGASGK